MIAMHRDVLYTIACHQFSGNVTLTLKLTFILVFTRFRHPSIDDLGEEIYQFNGRPCKVKASKVIADSESSSCCVVFFHIVWPDRRHAH